MASTNQPLSETAVANMAANTLDEQRITSLDAQTSFGRFVGAEFGFMRDEFLAAHPYAFAMAYAAIPEESELPPFRWAHSFQIPADCLRLLPLTDSGYFNGRSVKYERVGRRIFCDQPDTLRVRYIKRVSNLAEWDPLPARALGQYIALACAHRITGKNNYVEKAQAAFDRANWLAMHTDALERGTPEDMEQNAIIDVRSA